MAGTESTLRILRRLLASGLTGRAERLLARLHPADLGPLLSALTPEETRTVIDLLFRQHRAAETLRELPPELLPQIFEALGDERIAQVVARLDVDDMLEFVERLPEERRAAIEALLPPDKRAELEKARLYPEQSAGRLMTTRFLALPEKMTAQEAIDTIRASGDDEEAITYLYVVDEKRRLRGVVPLRRLVAAPPERTCGELMIQNPVHVRAGADQEEAARLVARYNLLAIPVTDDDGRLLGVITVDDVIDVITEEATEDMYHLAGLHDEDRVFSPPTAAMRQRLPWLLLNLGASFLVAYVIGIFERTLEQSVALAFFMPMVSGMAGNGGIQSLTVITRGIALGEIEFSSGLRAVAKEFGVAIGVGTVTGLVAGALAWLWQGNPYLGAVLAAAMLATMATAGILGAAVPLLLKTLGYDPAVGSGVVVTTLTDLFGFAFFLGIATFLLDRLA